MLVKLDAACEYFAAVSADGRLRVWDTATSELRQECVPGDLGGDGARATCIAWSRPAGGGGESAKKSKHKKGSGLGRVAIGADTGRIIVVDLATASLAATLDKARGGHSAHVHDLLFDSKGATLFSAADDKVVVQWHVASGEALRSWRPDKEGVRRLALSHDDSTLVTAALTLKLWDVASGECTARLRGHAEHVHSLAMSAGGRFLLTAAGERHVHLWRADASAGGPATPGGGTPAGKAAGGGRQCLQSLALEHTVHAVEFEKGPAAVAAERAAEAAGSAYLRFAVLVGSGAVHVWAHIGPLDGGAAGSAVALPLRVVASLQLTINPAEAEAPAAGRRGALAQPASALQCPIYAANLVANSHAQTGAAQHSATLVLALGSAVSPTFKRVATPVPAPNDVKNAGSTDLVAVDPPANLAGVLRAEFTAAGGKGRRAPATGGEVVLGAQHMPPALPSLGKKRAAADAALGLTDGPTLGERADAALRASASRAPRAQPAAGGAAQGQSAANARALLEQALQSGDDALLEEVLSVRKAAVIEATIAQLPAELLRPLLAALVQRAQSQPARAMELTQWLQTLLTTHTSYFLVLPQLHVLLAPLYQ
ncbi:quinon protein alcohol dehydrogenase-like superfamily, partial [Pavlovales sp. CCMP2436]